MNLNYRNSKINRFNFIEDKDMFTPITVDDFIKSYIENNPGERNNNIKEVLIETVADKKNGAKCDICQQPIWAIGSAIVGWNGCFTCITGEADESEDYEIEDVCFR